MRLVTTAFFAALIATPALALPPPPACPGDAVVWVNTNSSVFYPKGAPSYGNTSGGKLMCQHDAVAMGNRPARQGE